MKNDVIKLDEKVRKIQTKTALKVKQDLRKSHINIKELTTIAMSL